MSRRETSAGPDYEIEDELNPAREPFMDAPPSRFPWNRSGLAVALCLSTVIAFIGGAAYGRRQAGSAGAASGGREILYYYDPMHPSYRSDKPGIAPDCGMRLEPFYADGGPPDSVVETGSAGLPPGIIRLSPERQQLIGLKVAEAERKSLTRTIRAFGRVVPDEARVHRAVMGTEGWIREVFPKSTSTMLGKGDLLATLYSRDFATAQQSYIYARNAFARAKSEGQNQGQIAAAEGQVRTAEDNLLNIGVSPAQIQEIAATSQPAKLIELRAPVSGYVLQRNLYPGIRVERGSELLRVADVSRVWVSAEAFERDVPHLKLGQSAHVTLPAARKSFTGRISDWPPLYNPETNGYTVRIDVVNKGPELRPDMLVDVVFAVQTLPSLTAPRSAILDSGLGKTVFVMSEAGSFEAREVTTGWDSGEDIEILSGLSPGEKIVTAGNFLLDSESRLKAPSGTVPGAGQDPVCGMRVNPEAENAHTAIHNSKTYHFCSRDCKTRFEAAPEKYIAGN